MCNLVFHIAGVEQFDFFKNIILNKVAPLGLEGIGKTRL
jgi:hypothetical protein